MVPFEIQNILGVRENILRNCVKNSFASDDIVWCWIPLLHLLIGGSRGARPARAPLRVPILLFWHTKFLKRNCLGSPHPPYEVHAPPTGKSWIRHCLLDCSKQYKVKWSGLLCKSIANVGNDNVSFSFMLEIISINIYIGELRSHVTTLTCLILCYVHNWLRNRKIVRNKHSFCLSIERQILQQSCLNQRIPLYECTKITKLFTYNVSSCCTEVLLILGSQTFMHLFDSRTQRSEDNSLQRSNPIFVNSSDV